MEGVFEMRSDPMILVTCDGCGEQVDLILTATARGGYDERDVQSQLEQFGWLVTDSGEYCEECKEDHQ
jgi:hypothetical protein